MTLLDRLAARHKRAQGSITRRFLREFIDLWDLLAWDDLDGTYRAWSRQVMDSIRRWRQESAEAAIVSHIRQRNVAAPKIVTPPPLVVFDDGKSLTAFDGRAAESLSKPEKKQLAVVTHERAVAKATEAPRARRTRSRTTSYLDESDERPVVLVDWPADDTRAEKMLRIVGPVELKTRSGHGEREREAKREALVLAAGEAQRQVARGGRRAGLEMAMRDPAATHWARFTGTSRTGPCAFCVMLASRGPVYTSRAQANFRAHGNCQCSAEPVFDTGNYPGMDNVREWQALWKEATKGYSGRDARNAFRREWERLQREADRPLRVTA